MDDWAASIEEGFFKKGDNFDPSAMALTLSGGGYRAALFHGGVIIRFNELGLLPEISAISSVSGGSITAGLLAKAWDRLDFSGGVARNLSEEFLAPLMTVAAQTIDLRAGIAGLVPGLSAGNRLQNEYRQAGFDSTKLADLPAPEKGKVPEFIFNATSLQTGGSVRFSQRHLKDMRAFYLDDPDVMLATAVAASSAFPVFLAPLRLDLTQQNTVPFSYARSHDPRLRQRLVLVDGGVYDNLGLEAVWKDHGTIFGSYAGFNEEPKPGQFFFSGHLRRVIDLFLANSIDWRERVLVQFFQHNLADEKTERVGHYWTAGTRLGDFSTRHGVEFKWRPSDDELTYVAQFPTRLKHVKPADRQRIVDAGYIFADAGLRANLKADAAPPSGPPQLPSAGDPLG